MRVRIQEFSQLVHRRLPLGKPQQNLASGLHILGPEAGNNRVHVGTLDRLSARIQPHRAGDVNRDCEPNSARRRCHHFGRQRPTCAQ